jgi:amino acid transporter
MEEKPIVFVRRASGLVRQFGAWDIAVYMLATIIGAGILFFVVKGPVAFPGSSVPWAYLIIGVINLPFIITVALLMGALPRAGGMYVPISRILHPTIGFLAGWMAYVGLALVLGLLPFIAAIVAQGGLARFGVSMGPTGLLIMALIILAVFWLLNLAGVRAVRLFIWIFVIIPFIAQVGVGIYLLILGSDVASKFNMVYGSGMMEKIIAAAGEAGWKFPTVTLAATLASLAAVIFTYQGAEGVAFMGGEFKAVAKKIVWGMIGGFLIVMFVYIFTGFSFYAAFEKGATAYTFLQGAHIDKLKAIGAPTATPTIPFFVASAIVSKGWALLVVCAIIFWPIKSTLAIFPQASRALFSLSFDRAFPEVFSQVSPKGTPTYASHLTALIAAFGVFLMFYDFGPVLGILTLVFMTLYWCFGLSAMMVPFVRRDIFERLPIKSEAWVVILGLYSFLLGWFYFLIAAKDLNVPMIFVYIIFVFVGFIFYLVQQTKNKKVGIEISKIYAEIPPD